MNLFDECLLEADLDYQAGLIREIEALALDNIAKTRIIQADDRLVISAEFIDSKNKTRLPVVHDFFDWIKARSQGLPSIIGYKHIRTDTYLSVQEFNTLPDQRGHTSIYKYVCKGLSRYTTVGYSANEITIQISKLSHLTESRYHSTIDSLVALAIEGLIEYRSRKPVTQKRRYNAIREIILRRFKIKIYEWGLLFNKDISAALFPYLKGIAQRTEQGTCYLYESPRSDCKIKIYNITAAAERSNQPPSFEPGDRLKFEITYKAAFFDRKRWQVNGLTHQNDIARLLLKPNKERLKRHLIKKLSPTALATLWLAAGVSGYDEFMRLIDDEHTTQVATDERRKDLKALLDRQEVIEQLIEPSDANASVLAKIARIKAIAKAQLAVPDKRKVRYFDELKNSD